MDVLEAYQNEGQGIPLTKEARRIRTTIGIPAFNQADFLQEAIESALNQTVPCDVIVVNDGSTDLTKTLLTEYEDRVKVITQTNRGLPAARNTAIMNATTEYFLPLDADDKLEPDCIEKLEKALEDAEADFIAPSFQTFGTSNDSVMLTMRPKLEDFKEGNRVGYLALFKRSVLLEVGGYSPRMVWGYEDLHLTLNLLKRGKVAATHPEFLWKYRTKPNSMIDMARLHHEELMTQIRKDLPGIYD